MMSEASRRGVAVLRALALAVRSEQDYLDLPLDRTVVGALKSREAAANDALQVKRSGGALRTLDSAEYAPLHLREAMNKIAHANPAMSDFYVGPDDDAHDLLLYGEFHGRSWFAAISLLALPRVVKLMPDAPITRRVPDDPTRNDATR